MALLYAWGSEYLKNHTTGTIVILDDTIEGAREKALEQFYNLDISQYTHNYKKNQTEEDKREISERMELFKKDISFRPAIGQAVFLPGQ